MVIRQILARIFVGQGEKTSRNKAKQRLKFILAHDRVALTPQMFEAMRDEILQVVSKYVELDEESLQISLETDDTRNTFVSANMPIRSLREEVETAPEPDFEAALAEEIPPPTSPTDQSESDLLEDSNSVPSNQDEQDNGDKSVAETSNTEKTEATESEPKSESEAITKNPGSEPDSSPEATATEQTENADDRTNTNPSDTVGEANTTDANTSTNEESDRVAVESSTEQKSDPEAEPDKHQLSINPAPDATEQSGEPEQSNQNEASGSTASEPSTETLAEADGSDSDNHQ
jgi:cell division topological specificity factor